MQGSALSHPQFGAKPHRIPKERHPDFCDDESSGSGDLLALRELLVKPATAHWRADPHPQAEDAPARANMRLLITYNRCPWMSLRSRISRRFNQDTPTQALLMREAWHDPSTRIVPSTQIS